LWAGVAGGVAEYFDLDPSLVRLLFVLAAIVTWGAAVALYIAAWIILPRDDRPSAAGGYNWRDWSDEFHSETHRLAEEARRVADDVRSRSTWEPVDAPDASEPSRAATDKGSMPAPPPTPTSAASSEPDPWWQSERYVERHRHNHHPRTAGVVLVAVGVLFLAANAGLFSWIEWKAIWPLFLIGLGLMLFARQGWR
jgi:phage shock protein PspC (stress-responsive transcriptional regulator)